MRKSLLIPVFTILLLTIWSCRKNDTGPVIIYQENRDNHVNVTDKLVSIEDNLPALRAFTILIPAGDTLIFYDNRADLQFTAYDIYADTTIGRFGKFGNGPGEIANFGAEFYDPKSKKFYGRNGNNQMIVEFELPEAVSNPDYDAIDKFKIDFFKYPYISPCYMNDSSILCAIGMQKGTAEFQLANLNMLKKEISPLDSVSYYDYARYGVRISPEKKRIFTADMKQDVISIYSLDGELLRRIFGPGYTGERPKQYNGFSDFCICGDKIALCYADTEKDKAQRQLIITEIDGNYLMTLDLDFKIHTIAYHAKTNRLYLATDGEPQFCYLNLDELEL